jgi:hypothetical protein
MTELSLHPAIVHVPLGLAMVMPLLAAGLAWAVWRGRLPRGALAVVAGLQLVLAGGGFVAMRLGHADERQARLVAPHTAVHEHEEAAETFVWVSLGVLLLSAAALLVPSRAAPALGAVVAAGALAVAALGVDAGRKGGELVFRHGAAVAAVPGRPAAPAVAGLAGAGEED